MNKRILFVLLSMLLLIQTACSLFGNKIIVTVKNPLKTSRSFETVSVDLAALSDKITDIDSIKVFKIADANSKNVLVSQLVDLDGDGKMDAILFQPELKASEEKKFTITPLYTAVEIDSTPTCYSRFVPERTDDYAWENDRVAFRTYGPTAQKMKEDGVGGGTLSSGIDAWLKRVAYPIIDKWYTKELKTDGSYHQDTGEGLDNFHVGTSRGVGGVAIKTDSTYVFSKNFTSCKRLSIGPIRTSFVLSYADWDANGNKIKETKHISLDRGSNLSRFDIEISGTETLSAGLTLHENDGEVTTALNPGFISYWQPHKGSELGTAIVAKNGTIVDSETYLTDKVDESNAYARLEVKEGKVSYYAGFVWKKSGRFTTKKQWEAYLEDFAKKLDSPILVELN